MIFAKFAWSRLVAWFLLMNMDYTCSAILSIRSNAYFHLNLNHHIDRFWLSGRASASGMIGSGPSHTDVLIFSSALRNKGRHYEWSICRCQYRTTGRILVSGVPHKPQGDPKPKVMNLHDTLLPESQHYAKHTANANLRTHYRQVRPRVTHLAVSKIP